MKLAILILCHKNAKQINLFIDVLKCDDINFFIHVDKKSNISNEIKEVEGVHFVPDDLRIDVRWGEYSQIQATMNLIKYANKYDIYDFFWLCSGQDFPIKPKEYILKYLEREKECNYIQFWSSLNYMDKKENCYDKRNTLYYPKWIQRSSLAIRILKRLYVEITGGYGKTYSKFYRKDKISEIKSYFGSQWFCINRKLVNWILEFLNENNWYEEGFKHCSCPDESFFQTLFMLSDYKNSRQDFLHYIDWSEGKRSPKNLTCDDFEKIINSKFLMARKIDLDSDRELIVKLIDTF